MFGIPVNDDISRCFFAMLSKISIREISGGGGVESMVGSTPQNKTPHIYIWVKICKNPGRGFIFRCGALYSDQKRDFEREIFSAQ